MMLLAQWLGVCLCLVRSMQSNSMCSCGAAVQAGILQGEVDSLMVMEQWQASLMRALAQMQLKNSPKARAQVQEKFDFNEDEDEAEEGEGGLGEHGDAAAEAEGQHGDRGGASVTEL